MRCLRPDSRRARGRLGLAWFVRRWKTLAATAATAAVLYFAFGVLVPSLFVTVAPGPSPDVATLVTPQGGGTAAGASPGAGGRGRFLLTTVLASPATPLELYRALRSPAVDVAPRWILIPAGMSDESYGKWGQASMAESEISAAWQAWTFLGHPCDLRSDGARVFFVSRAGPARDRVKEGDVIVSWSLGGESGEVVLGDDLETGVRRAFANLGPGDGQAELTLRVKRAGADASARVSISGEDLTRWPFLGLALGAEGLRTDPPVPVSFSSGDIGGPSGGLMLALQIVDDFTPGDLTSGLVIAGSGTIGAGGTVGAVGGVDKKLRGAAAAGATVFLVPDQDYPGALSAIRQGGLKGLDLVPVGSLTEAYRALVSLTGKNAALYNRADLAPVAARFAPARVAGFE